MGGSFSAKALRTLGISAAALVPVTADAAIVHISGAPLVIGVTGGGTWDIDGVGGAEFDFRNRHSTAIVGSRTFVDDRVRVFSDGTLNGQGFPTLTGAVRVLGWRQVIGSPTPLVTGSSYGLGVMNAGLSRILTSSTHFIHATAPASVFYAFGQEPGFLGFAFDPGDGTRYGWAKVQFDEDGFNSSLTISEWAYQDTPLDGISAGSVPAPPAAVAGLTLLALGAAGVRAHRRRKEAAA